MPQAASVQKSNPTSGPGFWSLDFKALIPVVLFLVTQMIIGATWISSVSARLAVREAMVDPLMKRIERLESDRDQMIRVTEQLKTVSVQLDKLDKKLDNLQNQK